MPTKTDPKITEATEVPLSIFDYAAHAATGQALADAAAEAALRLAEAEQELEDAEVAEADASGLDASVDDVLRAKARLDLAQERLPIRKRIADAARLKADQHNASTDLAESLRPMAEALTGGHPGFGIHATPGEPIWENVPAPAVVIIQNAHGRQSKGGALSTSGKHSEPGVTFAYLRDPGFHADLLTGESILAAAEGRVTLGDGRIPLHPHQVKVRRKQLASGLTVTSAEVHVAGVWADVPVITSPDTSRVTAVAKRHVQQVVPRLASTFGVTPAVSADDEADVRTSVGKDGSRTTVAEFGILAQDPNGGYALAAETRHAIVGMVGVVVPSVGRVSEADYGNGRARLAIVSKAA